MNKSDLLRVSIDEFFRDKEHFDALSNLVSRRDGISLRNIEWFITNYSKRRNIEIINRTGKTIVVHCAYKSSLDGYSKKLFDPFCRTAKINYTLPTGEVMSTTIAQLNFIRWCIKTGILKYIHDNKTSLLTEYVK